MSDHLTAKFDTEATDCNQDNIRKKILYEAVELFLAIEEYIYGITIGGIKSYDYETKKYKHYYLSGELELKKEKFEKFYEQYEEQPETRKNRIKEKKFFKKTAIPFGEYNPLKIDWAISWHQDKKNKMTIKFRSSPGDIPSLCQKEESLFGYGYSPKKPVTNEFISFLKQAVEKLNGKNIAFGIFHDDVNLAEFPGKDSVEEIYPTQEKDEIRVERIMEHKLGMCGADALLELMEEKKISDFWDQSVFHKGGNDFRGDFKTWYSINEPLEEVKKEKRRCIEIELGIDLRKDFDCAKTKEKIKKVVTEHLKSKERISEIMDHELDKETEKMIKEKEIEHWSEDAKQGLKSLMKIGGKQGISSIFNTMKYVEKEKQKTGKKTEGEKK
ncbi:MAG: hypothetical protein ABH986_06355 [archaeon]